MIKNLLKRFFSWPNLAKLSKFQREEFAKVWFDISKLCVASLILKMFEPGHNGFDFFSLLTMVSGLTAFWLCVRLGLYIGKERL